MKFQELVHKTNNLPCFTTNFLAAGEEMTSIRLQLSRWIKDGRVIKLHKGLYSLAEPYRKVIPDPFFIANQLRPASYISLQSALSWYHMIPEFVPETSSITSGRPLIIKTPIGRFNFRHIKKTLFSDYKLIKLTNEQQAYIASPEKALLDLIYLTPEADHLEYLQELRLQNLHIAKSLKLKRAIKNILLLKNEDEGIDL